MARKMEVGVVGVGLLMIGGYVLLNNPEDTKKAAKDAVEIVAETGDAVKTETLDAVNSTGQGDAAGTSIVPAQVAGG